MDKSKIAIRNFIDLLTEKTIITKTLIKLENDIKKTIPKNLGSDMKKISG